MLTAVFQPPYKTIFTFYCLFLSKQEIKTYLNKTKRELKISGTENCQALEIKLKNYMHSICLQIIFIST